MQFTELVDAGLEPDMRSSINSLLELKMNTPEMGKGKRIDSLNHYTAQNLTSLKIQIDALPHEHKADWDKMNALFMEIV